MKNPTENGTARTCSLKIPSNGPPRAKESPMQTVTETPKTTTPAPAAAPAGPPTATEIADRVLKGIESAAGVAGTQVARVWPEMVRARWAEGLATLALTCLL